MSMDPYFNWYQNSNNITLVHPGVENVNKTDTNVRLPVNEHKLLNEYVLPGFCENNCVIDYGNAPNYVCHPHIPEPTNTYSEALSHHYSEYGYRNNLVDLSGFDYHITPTTAPYANYAHSIEHSAETINYDYMNGLADDNKHLYPHRRHINFEVPYTHNGRDNNLGMISKSNDFSIDDLRSHTRSPTARTMIKYRKNDDLRDVMEGRHTSSRGDSKNIRSNIDIEERKKDLKLRCRTEKRNRITKKENDSDDSRNRELKSRKHVKQEESPSNIDMAKASLHKSSKHKSEQKYSQSSIIKAGHKLKRSPSKHTDVNPGLLERKIFSKAQKSNLSPSALKRYLEYQRFLRNCCKSPSPQRNEKINKNKANDTNRLQPSEKQSKILKYKENSKEKSVKSIKNVTKIKTKENSKIKSNSRVDENRAIVDSKSTAKLSRSDQNMRKGESKIKVAKYEDQNVKRSKSKMKELIHAEQKRRKDEVNEKLARYLEKKKKRQELKERLFGFVDRNKEKAESEARLIKYLKSTKKRRSVSTDSNSCHPTEQMNNGIDLRTVLTRKRTKNHSVHESKRVKTTASQQDNLVITVKQDVNNKTEPPNIAHHGKVKTSKRKRIKLVINIVCSNSADSDSSDQTTANPNSSPHQDLSFLDDFNVDEIVDSLNVPLNKNPISQNNTSTENTSGVDTDTCTDLQQSDSIQIESLKIGHKDNSSLMHDDIHIQQEEIKIPKIIKANLKDEQEKHIIHKEDDDYSQTSEKHNNEKVKHISDNKQSNTTDTEVHMVPSYCDDVYEVIDITDESNSNPIILEEDIIDLDSNDHHDNIELLTKSSHNFKEKADTILLVSNNIIQYLEKDANEKEAVIETEAKVTHVQNIEDNTTVYEDEKVNSPKLTIAVKTNHQNGIDMTNKTTLSEINDSGSENMEANIILKNIDNQNIKPLNVKVANTEISNTDNQSTELDAPDTITKCHEDSILNGIATEPSAVTRCQSFKNITAIQVINKHVPIEKKTCLENTANIDQSHVALEPILEHINVNNIDKKSDEIKSVNEAEQRLLDVTTTKNDTNLANVKTTEQATESNNENIKVKAIVNNAQPSNIENTSKVSSEQQENSVSNVVINNSTCSDFEATNKIAQYNKNIQANQLKVPKYLRNPYVKSLERRMSTCLNENQTITDIIHHGYFSTIYKCKNDAGKTFALKVVKCNYKSVSIYRDKILMDLQKSMPENRYIGIIRIMESFSSAGEWCFFTEYYPKTLKEALLNGKCFHIDLVQRLAKQLVAAVSVLAENRIIHADIKPSHILLNNTNDKLKLCSFDRSDYGYIIRIIPSSGTASYRAPEMILGFDAVYGIDVWATALVMYEMATGIQLFPGRFNNDILFKQLCTLGPLSYDMLEKCTLKHMHFLDTNFMRQISNQKWVFVEFCGTNHKLRDKLFSSYKKNWKQSRTEIQVTEDLDKIEILYKLLRQMLVMDPRHRLQITDVAANKFINDNIDYGQ